MIDYSFITDRLKPLDPEKIILFGSYAKGNPNEESDIDVLVIKKTKKKPVQRIEEALKLVWGNIPHIEPHVMTPEEFNQAVKENRFFVTREIMVYGKTIYEKH